MYKQLKSPPPQLAVQVACYSCNVDSQTRLNEPQHELLTLKAIHLGWLCLPCKTKSTSDICCDTGMFYVKIMCTRQSACAKDMMECH